MKADKAEIMSFTLRIRAGDEEESWAIPTPCLSDLHQLEELGLKEQVAILWGPRELPPGEERAVKRSELSQAIERLSSQAKLLPPGFEIVATRVIRGIKVPAGGTGGMGGLKINGHFYMVRCEGRGWRICRLDKLFPGEEIPPEMRNVLRFDPAVLATENEGNVELRLRKGKKSDLTRLLAEIAEFLEELSDDEVYVTVG